MVFRHRVEGAGALAVLLNVGRREPQGALAVRGFLAQVHHALAVLVGQVAEQHTVHDTEEGTVGTDPQGEGDHDYQGVAGIFAQRAQGEA